MEKGTIWQHEPNQRIGQAFCVQAEIIKTQNTLFACQKELFLLSNSQGRLFSTTKSRISALKKKIAELLCYLDCLMVLV